MKKLAAAMLIAALATGCVACGSKEDTSANNASTDAAAEETTDAAESSDSKSYGPTDVEYHSVAEIQKRGEIHFATEATFAPYAFKDEAGNIVGLEPSMMQAIADEMGVKCVIDDMAFDSVLPSVQSGLDDMALAALSPTAERKEAFTFSESYLSHGQLSLIRAEDADKFKDASAMVAGVTMGAQKGSYQQTVAEHYYPDCTGRYMETIPNVIMDLKAGNIDIAIMDYDNATAYASQNADLATAFEVPMLEGEEPANCAAAMLGNTDLTDYVNTLIQKWLDDGTIDNWYNEAVALQSSLTDDAE